MHIAHLEQPNFALRALPGLIGGTTLGIRMVLTGPSSWMRDITEILGPEGLLANTLQQFSYRPQQQAMAEQVGRILEQGGVLITEAGTGTGKTFAYLIPALISGRKVIISTGTKNLQDQLFHRDLPLIKDALALPTNVALLKGRANYLCIHRMENTLSEGRLRSREMVDYLMQIRRWS